MRRITKALAIATRRCKEKDGMNPPVYVSKDDFMSYHFTSLHPLTEKIIFEYNISALEFKKLPYKKRADFNKMNKETFFDEEAYSLAVELNKEYVKQYNDVLDKYYDEILIDWDISKNQKLRFDRMMDVLQKYFEISDLSEELIFDLEDDILHAIK